MRHYIKVNGQIYLILANFKAFYVWNVHIILLHTAWIYTEKVSWLGKEASSLKVVFRIFSESSNFSIWISRTGSSEHLTVDPDPFVGDPLGSDEDGTTSVFDHAIIASIFIHVPPEDNAALRWSRQFIIYEPSCCQTNLQCHLTNAPTSGKTV